MNELVKWMTPGPGGLAAIALLATPLAAFAEVELKHDEEGTKVEVHIRGEHFTTLHYNDGEYEETYERTPFLWPVHGEGGVGLTRNFPMGEDAIKDEDHPHHRSLYFVFGDVNGHDHWHNHQIVTRRIEMGNRDDYAFIQSHNDWLDPDGEPVVHEVQELRFRDQPASGRLIELKSTLSAKYGDVTFGDDKEGLVALRVRPEIKGNNDGVMTNSRGEQGERNVYGTPAPWMDYSGPLEDYGWRGIAIFDHPDNFRQGYWHARDYGLLSLNPFSRRGVGGEDESGAHTIAEGESLTLRYAWFVHSGNHEEADIDSHYKKFAGEEP